jgi:hypothetical protein
VVPEGVSIQIDGGDWKHFPVGGTSVAGDIKGIDARDGTSNVNLKWRGGSVVRNALGIFNWTLTTNTFSYHPDAITMYSHLYGTAPSISGGTLKVDNMRFGILMGTFDVQTSGYFVAATPPKLGTASVRGVFRVKCLDCSK